MKQLNRLSFSRAIKIISPWILIVLFTPTEGFCQLDKNSPESKFIQKIYNEALTSGQSYAWLESLCTQVGHRLSGSPEAEKAVQLTKSILDTLGLDTVWLQPCLVPHWVRGAPETVYLQSNAQGYVKLEALALGGSVATPPGGIQGEVVEVKNFQELEALGEANIRGKIVFFNRPMDPSKLRTFEAYGGAVDQRVKGASKAAQYGAIGVLVRSVTLALDDVPHTGTLRYDSAYTLIPAAAISTIAANTLSAQLQQKANVRVSMTLNCYSLPDAPSFNVIGEIRGTEHPNHYMLVGGHLDSWDVGQGAHDDGAGCVQSMEVLRLLKKTGYRPKNSIRCVLFMNEENGGRGGDKYAKEAARKGETHVLAIESDAGGFTPRGFSFDSENEAMSRYFEKIESWQPLLRPYGLELTKGGSGADIGPLKPQGGMLSGYSPDSQRYFDYHHTATDVLSAVNKRELELGAASMTALIYLADMFF